jgi:hypothetical protein
MVRKVTLTPASVDALADGYMIDPHTPGLSIKMGANGQKTWRYRRRIMGAGAIAKLTLALLAMVAGICDGASANAIDRRTW